MIENVNYDAIYIDYLTKLDRPTTIVCCPRTHIHLRHQADGRVLKYPIGFVVAQCNVKQFFKWSKLKKTARSTVWG